MDINVEFQKAFDKIIKDDGFGKSEELIIPLTIDQAKELFAQGLGHEVRWLPETYVRKIK